MSSRRRELALADVQNLADVQTKPIAYLWRDLIPVGMLTLIAGLPAVAKSLLAHLVIAEVTRQGHSVIVSSVEEPVAQVLKPRLVAAGAVEERVYVWTPDPIPTNLNKLRTKIDVTGAKLFVLDTIAAHLAESIYSGQKVRRALTPLSQLAEKHECAFLGLTHRVKAVQKGAHPLAVVGGSASGLVAVARAVYLAGRSPVDETERILSCVKNNLGPEPPSLAFEIDVELDDVAGEVPRLICLGESPLTAKDLLVEPDERSDDVPAPKRSEAEAWLVGYLRCGPRPARQVKEDAARRGIKYMTLRRASDALGVGRDKGGPNAQWWLPQALLDELAEQDEADAAGTT